MKLLFISLAFPPASFQSGIVCAKYAIGLSQIGNEVDVLTADAIVDLCLDGDLEKIIEQCGIGVVRAGGYWGHGAWAYLFKLLSYEPGLIFLPRLLKNIRSMELGKYDCILTWSPFHLVNLVGACIKIWNRNAKWIAQFSDPWAANPLQRRWLRRAYANILEPITLRFSDGLLHVSRRAQDELIERNGWKGKPRMVIRHSYVEHLFENCESDSDRDVRRGMVVTYIGTLFGRRSPIPLFRALKAIVDRGGVDVSNVSICLKGRMDESFKRDAIFRLLPEGLVRFCDPVSYLESLQSMRDSDGLLLIEAPVSKNRFVPSKLADYLGAGPPIIALSRDAEIIEVVRASGGITADPEDVDSICEALLTFLRDFPIERSLESQKFVEKYDSRICAEELEGFLREVIAS